MAFTEVYVDPSIAADSGTGTIGDPYGDLEYAIEQTTFDTTNGTRVNVKAGTAEVLAAELWTAMQDTVTTVAWAPARGAPAVIQGYTAVAGDGGIAEIDGNALAAIIDNSSASYVHFIDLKLGNCGTQQILHTGNYGLVYGCELYGSSAVIATQSGSGGVYDACYIHDCTGTYSLYSAGSGHIRNCYVETDGVQYGIGSASGTTVEGNIVHCNGIGDTGIYMIGESVAVRNNSIYSSVANTADGILVQTNRQAAYIVNNLIEGFSGAGGAGITYPATGHDMVIGGNAFYNNTTHIDDSSPATPHLINLGDNETLTASPFNDAANGDFSPANVGNVIEGALPQEIGGGLV